MNTCAYKILPENVKFSVLFIKVVDEIQYFIAFTFAFLLISYSKCSQCPRFLQSSYNNVAAIFHFPRKEPFEPDFNDFI